MVASRLLRQIHFALTQTSYMAAVQVHQSLPAPLFENNYANGSTVCVYNGDFKSRVLSDEVRHLIVDKQDEL